MALDNHQCKSQKTKVLLIWHSANFTYFQAPLFRYVSIFELWVLLCQFLQLSLCVSDLCCQTKTQNHVRDKELKFVMIIPYCAYLCVSLCSIKFIICTFPYMQHLLFMNRQFHINSKYKACRQECATK